MFGWLRAGVARLALLERARRSLSWAVRPQGLIATLRLKFESCARYTSPTSPSPSLAIS